MTGIQSYSFFHDYRVWRSYREWCQNDSECKFWSMSLTSMFVYPQVNELTFYVLFGITHISSTSFVPFGCWPILGVMVAEWPITHLVFECRYWLMFSSPWVTDQLYIFRNPKLPWDKWTILLFVEIVATAECREIHEVSFWHLGELLWNFLSLLTG